MVKEDKHILLQRWVQQMIHPDLSRGPNSPTRVVRILLISWAALAFSLAHGIIYLTLSMPFSLAAVSFSLLCSALAIGLIRHMPYPRIAANVLLLGIFVAVCTVTVFTGGLYSPVICWLVVLVMCGAAFFGNRKGLSWAGIVAGLILLLFLIDQYDLTPVSELPLHATALHGVVIPLGLLIGVTIVTYIYEATVFSTERSLRVSKTNAEKALDELKDTQLRLAQFNFIASHDLQEPLRSIGNFAGLLHKRPYFEAHADDRNYLEIIQRSTDRMKSLVRDILHYSIIEKEREKENVDCNFLVQGILEDLSIATKESKATIKIGPLPPVFGNKTQLNLLFQNLIANAIKFRKEGISPVIHVGATALPEVCEFYIKDNGIGIAKKHQRKVFEVFQRLHLSDEYAGTGIGLALCQKVVEMNGGRLWFESEVGKGTTFHFSLPAARGEEVSPHLNRTHHENTPAIGDL